MEKIIWTLWWQGEEVAPSLVKACIRSMKKHSNGADVRVLSKDNYQTYITFPEHILCKFNKKEISVTHLSDIMRMQLLRDYGGLWMDSTVLLLEDIPEDLFKHDFWTLNLGYAPGISEGKWTGFLIGGKKNHILFSSICSILSEYWKNHDLLVDYFLIDYTIRKCYDSFPEIKEMVDNLPVYGNIFALMDMASEPGSYENICTPFQKMSWKRSYAIAGTGGYSRYAQILIEYNIAPEHAVGFSKNEERKRHLNIILQKLHYFCPKALKFGFCMACWDLMAFTIGRCRGTLGITCRNKYDSLVFRYLEKQPCYQILMYEKSI